MTPKIFTVTANTAIDHVIEVEHLRQSDNLQAKSSREFAAGKGVNVAKALESLNCPVTVLGFVGQESLNLFDKLESDYMRTDFISVAGKTRTNLTLIDAANKKELHVRTPGYCVNPEQCDQLIKKIKGLISRNDIIIFSGSLPQGAPDDFYLKLIGVCRRQSAIALLDSSGNALRQGICAGPYLIKPNQHELEELISQTITSEKECMAAARSIINQGVQWVVVSRGSKGFIAINQTSAIDISVPQSTVLPLCSVGCGDSLVAGIAYALSNNYDPSETCKYGAACATANLTSVEPGRINKQDVEHYLSRVGIEQL